MRVTNHGPDRAADLEVTDTAIRPLKILSAVPSQGVCQLVAHPMRCLLGSLRVGATARIRITAQARRTGTLRNTASATSASHDPRMANNLSTAHIRIVRRPRPPHRHPRPPHRHPPRLTG